MHHSRSTPISRPSTARKGSSVRPNTAHNYSVIPLDTGFYPQTHLHHDMLMKQWSLQGFQWVSCCDGQMPIRAVQSGRSRAGEPVYIARALSPGMTHCLGIFHPPSGCCYFLWQGKEYSSKTYEILCGRPKLQSRNSTVTAPIPTLGDSLKVMTIRSPLKFSNYRRM